LNVDEIRALKGKRKIIMLTAYDYQIAKILDTLDVDIILIGDSLGMVVQGYPDTKSVTIEDMIYHTRIVARATKRPLIVSDMPINSYNEPEQALTNARRLLEVGAHAVKIEGNFPKIVKILLEQEIPVMGHIGHLPQTSERVRVQGKRPEQADQIWRDALQLDKLGVFGMVVELVPQWLARKITVDVKSPTIGIGASKYCDGQVLVTNDLLGLDEDFKPKFVKQYANLHNTIVDAIQRFIKEVKTCTYPDRRHTYH
jgi:3-methyl-2-oxobutanoate hydroxymethyltransferase